MTLLICIQVIGLITFSYLSTPRYFKFDVLILIHVFIAEIGRILYRRIRVLGQLPLGHRPWKITPGKLPPRTINPGKLPPENPPPLEENYPPPRRITPENNYPRKTCPRRWLSLVVLGARVKVLIIVGNFPGGNCPRRVIFRV